MSMTLLPSRWLSCTYVLLAVTCADAAPPLGGIPTVTIAPGVNMPLQGVGTWLYNETRAYGAVLRALTLEPTPYGEWTAVD